MSDAATLSILIDIRSRLDQIDKTQQQMRGLTDDTKKANEEANKLGNAVKTGFGIDLARRGMNLLTQSLRASVASAVMLAANTKDISQNLNIDTESLQVLSVLVKDAGGDFENLNQGIVAYRSQLNAARAGNGEAARTFRQLFLNADELASLPLERQIEMIAKRLVTAGKGTVDFDAAVSLLGRRNAPRLMQALKELAEQGYDKVAKSAKDAGLVMEQDTIERLDRAQKQIEKLQRKITIDVGEGLASLDLLRESASKDMGGTAFGWLKAMVTGDYTDLAATVAANVQQPKNTPPPTPPPVMASAEDLLMAELHKSQTTAAEIGNDPVRSEISKRSNLINILEVQIELYQKLIALNYANVREPQLGEVLTEKQLTDLREWRDIQAKIHELRTTQDSVAGFRPSAYTNIRQQAEGVNDRTVNGNYLSMGQGVGAGAMQWVTQLGSAGQQVAGMINSSIGAAVNSVSEGIYGWVTGTQSFGDVLINLGDTIFQTLIQTIVQMGVQWLVTQALMKMGLISTQAVHQGLQAQRIAGAQVEGTSTAAAMAPAAATSSIASFGLAAAIGIAALLAVMAAFGGFADGGYTGSGGKHEVAGVAHRGEVVYSQADIARHGGVAAVEAMRVGGPEAMIETMAVPMPVPVAPVSAGAPIAAAALAAGAAGSRRREKPTRTIVVDNRRLADQLRDDPAFETYIQDMITGNPGKFGIPS